LMEFVPWTTFARLVERYGGDHRVRTLTCAEQYRAMAFAQLTYRESLRDIEACLSAQAAKLYHMGFREPVRRSTLADANETRDWRIYAALAQTLIVQARRPAQVLGSCGYCHWRVGIVGWPEFLSKAGTECAIIDSTTNLKQQIGPASRPPHLLRFVHPTVYQEIGRPFGDRGANSQPSSVTLGIVDQPLALSDQITIQRV